jgi:hypothetical protein
VIKKILAHLGLPTDIPRALPARSPPWSRDDARRSGLDF